MLEIIRKCLNIRIFSKNADVSIFLKFCFYYMLYWYIVHYCTKCQRNRTSFYKDLNDWSLLVNCDFPSSNIFSCCRHPSVLCDILAMPPLQTTHLCFLKPLMIYLTSEQSEIFSLSRWYLPQKMPGLLGLLGLPEPIWDPRDSRAR